MKTARDHLKANLKRLRLKHGLTQAALAEAIDLSLRGYQKYEQGEAWPDGETFDRLSVVLECEGHDLIAPIAEATAKKPPHLENLGFAAQVLQALANIEQPLKQQYILALIFDDEKYLEAPAARALLQKVRKSL